MFGPDAFNEARTIDAVCRKYGIPPRTMRYNLNTLRLTYCIGRDGRLSLADPMGLRRSVPGDSDFCDLDPQEGMAPAPIAEAHSPEEFVAQRR